MDPFSLQDFVATLDQLAPPGLAAEWDNTGLLLEPATPRPVKRVLLTLDLTPQVAREAIRRASDCVVAYHPPIFGGVTSLTRADPLTRALLELLEARVAVHSPHTALDAAPGGVSEWLAEAVDARDSESVGGSGRRLTLRKSLSLDALGAAFASHARLPYLRVAKSAAGKRRVRTLGICPGAGASVLGQMDVEAVFTGELKHHDLLAFTRAGVHAILSEHSHTERPYLRVLRKRLLSLLPEGVQVDLARADRDPLTLRPADG